MSVQAIMLTRCNDLFYSWFLKLSLVGHLILILLLTMSFSMTAAVVSMHHVFLEMLSALLRERRWCKGGGTVIIRGQKMRVVLTSDPKAFQCCDPKI